MINCSSFEMSHILTEFPIPFTGPNMCDSNAYIFNFQPAYYWPFPGSRYIPLPGRYFIRSNTFLRRLPEKRRFFNKIATRPRRSLSKMRTFQRLLFLFISSAPRWTRLMAICQWKCPWSSGNLRHPLNHNESWVRLHRMKLGSSSASQVE